MKNIAELQEEEFIMRIFSGLVMALCIMFISSLSFAGEAAGVYNDADCYIGGETVSQDGTCPHGYFASNTMYVATPSGNMIMTCQFDEFDIPGYCQVDKLYMNKDFACYITYVNKDGVKVSVLTYDSQFVKTPGNQATLKCSAKDL